jgi:glycosyltransferase involved in cell wall biosynthesis
MSVRVLQMIDSLSTGGAETLLLTYAQQAAARGIQPTILALRNKPGAVLPQQLREAGARVEFVPGRGLLDPRRVVWIARFLRRERVDILHAHLEYATILGALAGALARVPVVVSVHNTKPERREKVELLALRYGARRIIAVGRTIAESYGPMLKGRSITVVPNPVSLSPAVAQKPAELIRRELAGDPSRPLLVSVGRLERQKGYPDLLSAMDILRRSHPGALLVVAGTGRIRDELIKRIRECDLQEQVRLLGLREDVPQLLAAADLYISASRWEGLPIAILEAMASGLPIGATAVGDVPEILSDGRGMLVPAAQPEQLARAAAIVLENRKLAQRLGAAARDYVSAHHRADAWFDELFKIYAEAAGRPRQGA